MNDRRLDPPSLLCGMTADHLRAKVSRKDLNIAGDEARLLACVFAALRDDGVYVGKLVAVFELAARNGRPASR